MLSPHQHEAGVVMFLFDCSIVADARLMKIFHESGLYSVVGVLKFHQVLHTYSR